MTDSTASIPVISIIEDDESLRVAIAGLLRAFEYVVREFKSADEFLQSPELHYTSCVISDVNLPGIGGLELQSRLVAQNIETPIILITAGSDTRKKERALRAGAICFLKKPFDGQVLVECLETALRQNLHC